MKMIMKPTIKNILWRTIQERAYLPSGAVLTGEYSYMHIGLKI